MNLMSLLLVGVGLALTATFFVGSPFTNPAPAVESAAKGGEPALPAIQPPKQEADSKPADPQPLKKQPLIPVPKNKTLEVTIPAMKRVHDAKIPYARGTDEAAFKYHAGVHILGTGFPWQKVANVYIAGHRLGYVGTASWLGFWDLNNVKTGDKVFVIDALGRHYVYKVYKVFVVDPDDVQVTQPVAGKNILTLQTCTLPDYSRRLIVRADRVEGPVPLVPKGAKS